MELTPLNPTGLSYSQAMKASNASTFVFISGQVPERVDGRVPDVFEEQCRLTWRNIERQLTAAGMTLQNLVKVTVFLCDRKYRAQNAAIRKEVLGEHSPALTILIAGIYDESWLLEIEAVAAT